MGPYYLTRKLENSILGKWPFYPFSCSHSCDSCHFLPRGYQQAFTFLSSIETLRCFGFLIPLLQSGPMYTDSKCEQQTSNYPHAPHHDSSCNSSESSLTMSPSPYPLAYSAGSVPCTRLVLGCCQPSWWDLIAGMQLSASNYAGIVKLAASTPTVWVTLILFAKRREDPSWALRNTILRLRSVKITFPI